MSIKTLFTLVVSMLCLTGDLLFADTFKLNDLQSAARSEVTQQIPSGNTKGEAIALPAVQIPENMSLLLKFNMRLIAPSHGGWGNYTSIDLNGKNIGKLTPDGKERMLGRGQVMLTVHPKDKQVPWFRPNVAKGYILTLFGPENSENIDGRITSSRDMGCNYYLDVTDLVKSGNANTLQFTNHLPRRFTNALSVKDVQFLLISNAQLAQLRGEKAAPAAGSQAAAGATYKSTAMQKIPAGGSTGESITFPAIEVPENMGVVLKLNMRLLSPRPSGWGNCTSIELNGKNLGKLNQDGQMRILMRGNFMQTVHPKDKQVPWFRPNVAKGYILTLYGPENSENIDQRITAPRQMGYNYCFDVTDLVKNAASNTLRVSNNLPRRFGNELLVKDVQISLMPLQEIAEQRAQEVRKSDSEVLNAPLTPATKPSPAVQRIQPGGKKGPVITMPAVRVPENMSVILKVNLRLLAPRHGGWGQYASINLNGKNVGMLNSAGLPRLLGRGSCMKSILPKERTVNWFRPSNGSNCILTYFGPAESEEIDPRIIEPRQFGFNYYFDVTDIVRKEIVGADNRIESEGNNELQFFNHLATKYQSELLVKDIQFFLVPRNRMLALSGVKLREFDTTVPAACSFTGNNWKMDVTPGGGIRIISDGEAGFIESEYSYPATPAMKFNKLGTGGATGKNIKVSVKKLNDRQIQVLADTPDYRIERVMTNQGYRVQVKDTITNLTDQDLGIAWRHCTGYNQIPKFGSRMAGQSNSAHITYFGSSNPTVFVRHTNSAIGLVAEDTVSRAQMFMDSAGNTFSMGSEGLGLAARKSVTQDWLIYPWGKNKDYFDFINQVRRDWKVNRTVIGPFKIHASVIPGIRFQIVSIGPWYNYGHGSMLTDEEYAKQVKPACEKMRKANPGAKLIAQLETNLVPFDTSKYPWGKKFPLTYGNRKHPNARYAQFITAELTQKLDSVSPYKDSLIRDANGNAMIDTYYVYEPIPLINLMVQPERGNYRYKTFFKHIDFLMDKLGFDGVYIDQFIPYTVGGFSEDRWDGYTVILDETGKIKNKRYSYAITGAAARADIVKHVINKGGFVVTNGHPISREEQNTGVLSFQEMENDLINPVFFMDKKPPEGRWQTVGHLASPIILGLRPIIHQQAVTDGRDRRAEILTKGIITGLRNGLLHYYYSTEIPRSGPEAGGFELCNRMFPFTPVELNEGYLIGEERTITAVSGSFKVKGKKAPQVTRFNLFGQIVKTDCPVSGSADNWQVKVDIKDWCEVVIIEVQN